MPQPQSSWLASPPAKRLRVGECVVDVPLREIVRADGSRTRVTLKSMAVLLVLAEHAGRVVTRDALLESVWAGTMPTIDVVTQAVVSLRKALGGDSDPQAYVETIPKTGYRLLATTEWLPKTPVPMQPPAAHAPPARWRFPVAITAGLALLATLSWSMAGWQSAPTSSRKPGAAAVPGAGDIAYTLLTSRPGRETDPALSPDGASVAYSMPLGAADGPSAIFVQSAQPTPPRQLTTPPPGDSDHWPRWSRDGRQLMFARMDAQDGCKLMLLPASGGVERMVGRCDRFSGARYDWLPDGSGIVAGLRPDASGKPAPLSILRLDTGQWQPMDYPIEADHVDFDPRFSSDGSRLGFRRNLSRSDIWVMPAQGGAAQRMTYLRGDIMGWDWAPDDRSLLLGLGNGEPQLVRHDIATGRSRALGRVPATGLDIAAGGNMVFGVDDARIAIFRYPLPLREAVRPEQLFASTGTDLLPSPSPDGRMVAFRSNRSREVRLWIGEPDNPGRLRMIEGFIPVGWHPPQWSPDGARLLVVGEPAGADANPGPRLYEVDVASGRATTIALSGFPYFAQYLPEHRLLAIVDLGSGKWSLRILDEASPARVLAEMGDVGEARFDPASGRVHLVRIDGPGLWHTGLELGPPALVDAAQPAVYWIRWWAPLGGKVFSLQAPAPGCQAGWRWMDGASAPAAGCLDRERRGVPRLAPMPSRDGDWLYASMMTGQGNSDIGMIDLDALIGTGAATP